MCVKGRILFNRNVRHLKYFFENYQFQLNNNGNIILKKPTGLDVSLKITFVSILS